MYKKGTISMMTYTKAGHKSMMKPVYGVGIYKGTKRRWESIEYCAKRFGVSDYAVRHHIRSGKELNGFILSFEETK